MKKFLIGALLMFTTVSVSASYTVVAIVEAKPGQEAVLQQALIDVVEPSRSENTCLEYRLHQDLNNPAQFVLYETWVSQEAHQQQFQKPYIVALAAKLPDLLGKPYQVIFAQQLSPNNHVTEATLTQVAELQ